ncbi:hypothetical protein ACFQ0X_01070 [Streptomyces rectiviolaceus]|uniref:Integral membrane protein n=1 Tax=Streptomyces rectiviolaceus TaxID=332591 RepID=A0ABP6M6Y9_9ACTN
MTSTHESTAARDTRTGVAGGLFRASVALHTVVAFGQPVFAGVFLTGDIDGLELHARGADVVFALGLAQAVAGVVLSVRTRWWWPASASLLLVVAESVQYMAGMDGALWLHLPLGVAVIAALVVLFAVVWTRPLPGRVRSDG